MDDPNVEEGRGVGGVGETGLTVDVNEMERLGFGESGEVGLVVISTELVEETVPVLASGEGGMVTTIDLPGSEEGLSAGGGIDGVVGRS